MAKKTKTEAKRTKLANSQKKFLNKLRDTKGVPEFSKGEKTTIANLIKKYKNAGEGMIPLLDELGLDVISVALVLKDCAHNATREGRGKEGSEVTDYKIKLDSARTVLELRRELGPGRPKASTTPVSRSPHTGPAPIEQGAVLGPEDAALPSTATTDQAEDEADGTKGGSVPDPRADRRG